LRDHRAVQSRDVSHLGHRHAVQARRRARHLPRDAHQRRLHAGLDGVRNSDRRRGRHGRAAHLAAAVPRHAVRHDALVRGGRVPAEMRRVFVEGMRYGLEHPVVRPVMLASLVSMSFMIFGFYSWQRYFLDLLGRNLVWVDGVISSLVGLSLIAGNALVGPVSRVVRTRTGMLMLSVAVQAASVVLCGLLTDFYAVVALYLVYGAAVGLAMPVKQA